MSMLSTIIVGTAIGVAAAAGVGTYLVATAESEFVSRCERVTMQFIKAPATYARYDIREGSRDADHVVIIDFDSQNGFGALVRSTSTCRFEGEKLAFALVGKTEVSGTLLDLF